MEILYYVSGHGYGHATRSSEILRALVARQPDWTIHVRSNVPPHLLAGIERVVYHPLAESLDPGVVEQRDSLGLDVPATLGEIERYYGRRKELVAAETSWLARRRISLIAADFPPLAGEVATAAGIACLGIGNFTWDWIYEPLIDARRRGLLDWLREGYRQMSGWLKLPFSHAENQVLFPWVRDVPLVARRPRQEPTEVLRRLGIARNDRRPRIVLGMRGRIPIEARAAAANENPEWLFLHFESAHASVRGNEVAVTLSPDLLFTDVLNICDVVVSKFGYGMLSECIATKKRLLAPPRRQFREDEIFDYQIGNHLRYLPISHADFTGGRWRYGIERLLSQPPVEPGLATNGAEMCAEAIAREGAQV
ncbi:MAG TPA: hypothetical protein VFI31_22375 [Pirellulales bacterium]|nr:hypothetical protein [Pirellulales bacterium]